MLTGIYAIVNTRTNQCYVGQAIDAERRRKSHFGLLRRGTHHCARLQRAFNRDGELCFDFATLETCDAADLTAREQHWMDACRARLYNHAPAAGSPLGIKRSDATRAKMRLIKAGRKASELEKAHRRELFNERPELRDVSRANGIAAIPRLRSVAQRQSVSLALRGRVLSQQTRAKIAARLKGKPKSPEHVAAVIEACRGRRHSDATKAKMKAAQSARREIAREKALAQWARVREMRLSHDE